GRYGFSHSSFHRLLDYEAYTQTPENKKISVSDFKTSDDQRGSVFYDDVKETLFDFPGVAAGSIGTLKLNYAHEDAHLLSPFYFSRRIPVINSQVSISFPKDMKIKYLLRGYDTSVIKINTETKRNEVIYTFSVKDLPAENRYPDAPDNAWYSPHVIFYIENYKDEDGKTISYLANTDDLFALDKDYVKSINKEVGPALQRVIDSLTDKITGNEEKARKIYSWVQQNIKYVAFEAGMEGFVPRDANLICNRRFGDCKDMSSILTTMLNKAGVPAYYTWIGTRDIPYRYTEVPTTIVDNHMICTIRLNDKYIFLDGTDPFCVFGIPPDAIQDKEALVMVSDKEYKIITVPIIPKDKNIFVDSTIINLNDKEISGTISQNMQGYFAESMNATLTYTDQKDWNERLKGNFNRGSNKFNLISLEVGDRTDKNKIRISGKYRLLDYAKKLADEYYINLNLIRHFEHQEIDYPKRKSPIESSFLYTKKYVIVLNIPDGYKISYLPSGKSFHNEVWGFDLSYEQKAQQVIYTLQFDNNQLLLTPDKFEAWNKVLENLIPMYKESVSLEKK
ncbi:MAG: transglutaminase domain-containing protein, partial [Sphingobacteriales bacterium]|nr:transglutaminase domain-containing protein [Sphingobacteriales bacterium]